MSQLSTDMRTDSIETYIKIRKCYIKAVYTNSFTSYHFGQGSMQQPVEHKISHELQVMFEI